MLELERANNFKELISLIRNSRRQCTKQYSYRQLADQLGYRSPRSLAMVHKGQRAPSYNLVRKLISHLSLAPHEVEFISLLAENTIAEKKQIPTIELEQKISNLKNLMHHFQSLEINKCPLEAVLYLDASDVERVNTIF